MAELLRLHLGCGPTRLPGYLNCDLIDAEGIDHAFDLQEKWPFQDDSAVDIYASHVLEHLRLPHAFFREAWRVLHPAGRMYLRLPYGGHDLAWVDLSHIRPWFPGSFAFLQPGYGMAVRNSALEGWSWPYAVDRVEVHVSAEFVPRLRSWWRRRLLVPWLDAFMNAGSELRVWLSVLKTEAAVAEFSRTHAGNAVPAGWVVQRHVLEGRPLAPGEAAEVIELR